MANPTVRRSSKVCAYADCGQLFRPKQRYAQARYCSRQCATADRPRSSFVAAGHKGGTAHAAKAQPAFFASLADRLEPLSKRRCWVEGRRYQRAVNQNRLRTERQKGFHEGFDAAMKALRPRKLA